MTIPMRSNPLLEYPMRSLMCVASVLVVLGVAGWLSQTAGAANQDEIPSIEKIMKTLHAKKGKLNAVRAELKQASPDWAKVEEDAKEIVKFGGFLVKSEPHRGEKSSFEKLAKSYESRAKELEQSAQKKDREGAQAAMKKLGASCKTCHEAHKEP
jgi:cytochrome c556